MSDAPQACTLPRGRPSAACSETVVLSPNLEAAAVAKTTSRASRLLRAAIRYVPILAALTLARSTLADQYHVPTSSMWPTIEPGDRIFVEKCAYGLRVPFTDRWVVDAGGPDVGDVIVFSDPRGGPVPLVKRVVAVGGQTVQMKDGVLFVDGRPQRIERLGDGRVVEHLGEVVHDSGSRDFEDFGPVVVAPDHFFAMGDNRANSMDSRVFGAVPRNLVRGRVVGTVYRYGDEGFDGSRLLRGID